ncbi:MAG: hypothetical protein AB1896_23905, partial [Thermodesulfobacteriota bacterium]
VDILVDLSGHNQGNRLDVCSQRPAPINVFYLGFAGTTGADFIDYLIADRTVAPPEEARYFSEKLVLLPHTYLATDREQEISARRPTRAELGLPEEAFVFCCFNGHHKLEPVMFAVWMKVLQKTPGSVLWLITGHDLAQANLRREAANRGVDPGRLVFGPRLPKAEHLARVQAADLALDTLIYKAHTTTSDALWAGVPAITFRGSHFASRVPTSLLNAIGLPDLVAQNLEEYEALAVRLAQSPVEMDGIKKRLEKNRTKWPLFDTPRFTRNLEKAYLSMWEIYRSGQPPRFLEITEDHR